MIGPQPFLGPNGVSVAHLQFKFLKGVSPSKVIEKLGNLWSASLVGTQDPQVIGVDGHSIAPEFGAASGSIIVGFRPEWWRALDASGVPSNLKSWTEDLKGIDGLTAPATQNDLWLWLNQSSTDRLWDTISMAKGVLAEVAELAEARECFTYHNSLTLDGFVDGIGNPSTFRSPSVTVIPPGQPGANGTTVLVQKWLMEVPKMRALTIAQGECVYGRTKLKARQLDPLPERSHVARNQYYDSKGDGIDIVRRNAYFGDAHESGVMFVGFASNIDVSFGMLKQMYGVGPDGIKKTDALLDYSHPVSGAIYFVPSFDDLVKVGVKVEDQP